MSSVVFAAMLREAKITPILERRLTMVPGKKATIVAFETDGGDTFAAKLFVDATYEGDLMAAAGVKYHVGREARRLR
ncbi:MAG: FAD-dependent oxidoreductase [Gemmataceae bacterium]